MRGDRRRVTAKRGSGDRRFRRLTAQLFQRAERKRQKGRPGLRLGEAGRLPERARRLREEGHLRAGRHHGGGMVERAGPIAGQERRHPEPDRELREIGGGAGIAAGNARREALKAISIGSTKRPQRMERSRPRAFPPRGGQRRKPESAGYVRDELAGTYLEPPAHLRYRLVGNREKHDVDVAQRGRLEAAAPVPGREHPDAGEGQRLEQRSCHRATAQHCRGLDHSRRNSTPEPPAQASNVSPLLTRPARISSASGDSTSRWITCRIGLAPSASWYPPEAIR